ncbi:RluA family pseudouridine synthase [Amphiplicatus metriothermophilus]|uniref:tRNA pseudouridine32 synthase / 23S rRNA pseudouridine746 synthase/23S rRNA pseudouridine1911/1915/1917 synthase n=1 Tax=Amphiplicatus metriothermophilus TaxID=1519374 RepID=A0A239PIY9_9PROT|nr:RNA pseudouridine synthase [Amphiplicatus metriothermophilus]MBB5517895.1 tRNA pseudouridine32 synthase/23S rRNA pseudouridine746 synthase/23S rRNA pseudouridine1911/1915/1917 synthase [Amphiplicatus metriothermophilus]SNT67771.1 tRNA pseudouridine32 synthase / 23S rRNA pseudouridine746 synthase/23S rRNA pseudouridine1911/1915/1917 synthase [Amphiplicatus metriothermophilus]
MNLLDRVLYRDGLMLVIDKPAGIPVHAGPGGGDNLENYFDQLRFGLPRAPALAHRLDRDTSGCLVLGRHPKALRKLHRLFSEGRIRKSYWAICQGVPEQPSGTIDAPLKKKSRGTGWRVEIAADGQEAITAYRVIAAKDGLSFIEAKPKTGRTHQLRVHLAHIGAPILGDPQYGDLSPQDRAWPMMLHARRVVIPISANKNPVTVEAAPPEAMAAAIQRMANGE